MYLWKKEKAKNLCHRKVKILPYLGNISVTLYVPEISAECRVISEGNISYSLCCKLLQLYELAFGSKLHLCFPNSYSRNTKLKKSTNKKEQGSVLSSLRRAAVLFYLNLFYLTEYLANLSNFPYSYSFVLKIKQSLILYLVIILFQRRIHQTVIFIFWCNVLYSCVFFFF